MVESNRKAPRKRPASKRSKIKSMLSEAEKARIRDDESTSHDVRLELEQSCHSKWSKALSILNQPIVIWILSSIVVGLVSFFYTNWKNEQDERYRSATQIASLEREAYFRLRQVYVALTSIRTLQDKCLASIQKGELWSEELTNYRAVTRQFVGTVALGGMGDIPFPMIEGKSGTIRIRYTDYDQETLLYGRGYRYEQYSTDSLADLYAQLYLLRFREALPESLRREIESKLKELESKSDFDELKSLSTIVDKSVSGDLERREKFKAETAVDVAERVREIEELLESIAVIIDSPFVSQYKSGPSRQADGYGNWTR